MAWSNGCIAEYLRNIGQDRKAAIELGAKRIHPQFPILSVDGFRRDIAGTGAKCERAAWIAFAKEGTADEARVT